MDNSKSSETWTPVPQYGQETRTDELETPKEKFNKTVKALDGTYQRKVEPDTQKRRELLEKSIPDLVISIGDLGGITSLAEEQLKAYFESLSHAISGEAIFNDIPTNERYQVFKPALDLIKDNANFISEGSLYYYNPFNFADNYDPELAKYIEDPEGYTEPIVKRDFAMVEGDLKLIEDIDENDFIIPKFFSEEFSPQNYREAIYGMAERPDDVTFALVDMAFQIKMEDGQTEDTLNKLKEVLSKKGEKIGFSFAVLFLNELSDEKVRENGTITSYKANEISEGLQVYLLDLMQGYLDSNENINDQNLVDVSISLFDLERTIDRSVVWFDTYLKAEMILTGNEEQAKEKVAEIVKEWRNNKESVGDGSLHFDNVLRLIGMYRDFVTLKVKDKKVEEFESELTWDNYARMKLRVDHELEKYRYFTGQMGVEV